MGSNNTSWNRLGHSPFQKAEPDDKWDDFKGPEMETLVSAPVGPEDEHKAQLNVVVTARRAGLSDVEAKELLSALGIDEKVELDVSKGD